MHVFTRASNSCIVHSFSFHSFSFCPSRRRLSFKEEGAGSGARVVNKSHGCVVLVLLIIFFQKGFD